MPLVTSIPHRHTRFEPLFYSHSDHGCNENSAYTFGRDVNSRAPRHLRYLGASQVGKSRQAMSAQQVRKMFTDQFLALRLSRELRRSAAASGDRQRIVQRELEYYPQGIE